MSEPGERSTVLFVDDEDAVLASIRRLLRKEPYRLSVARSATEALEVLESEAIDLIVCDQLMPEMSGIELLSRVRDRWPDTVRIVLSGYSKVESIISAINDGAIYKFVTKPWQDEELKLQIRRALEQSQLAKNNRAMAEEIERRNRELRELNERLTRTASELRLGMYSTQRMVNALAVGVVVVDPDGMLVHANPQAVELVSPNDEDVIGRRSEDVLPEPVTLALVGDEEGPTSGRLGDAAPYVQWRVQPAPGEKGEPLGKVITLWEDVAAEKTRQGSTR